MNNILKDNKTKFITITILVVAISRLLPHPYNFTPIGAMALFGGTFLKDKKIAFGLPLAALLISDLLLQLIKPGSAFYEGWFWVYLSFILITPLGFLLGNKLKVQNVIAASLMGSILFFVLTNFGVWTTGLMYPLNGAGLMCCYVSAVPFFGGTIMGDLFFNALLFGVFAIAKWRMPLLVKEV